MSPEQGSPGLVPSSWEPLVHGHSSHEQQSCTGSQTILARVRHSQETACGVTSLIIPRLRGERIFATRCDAQVHRSRGTPAAPAGALRGITLPAPSTGISAAQRYVWSCSPKAPPFPGAKNPVGARSHLLAPLCPCGFCGLQSRPPPLVNSDLQRGHRRVFKLRAVSTDALDLH